MLAARQRPGSEGLSAAERDALGDYKGGAGRLTDGVLHGAAENRTALARAALLGAALVRAALLGAALARAALLGAALVRAALLGAALARAGAPADMVPYRGVGPTEALLYCGHARGATVHADAVVSPSVSAGVAATTARGEDGAVMEISVRRGQKGVAYVHPFPTGRCRQHEVRLNAGTRL
jgi:hypothetical protein